VARSRSGYTTERWGSPCVYFPEPQDEAPPGQTQPCLIAVATTPGQALWGGGEPLETRRNPMLFDLDGVTHS
jgi:hypothetical protein